MRIEFARGSHEPVAWSGGSLRIGSAADNDVCLAGDGVAAHHARLVCDGRGLVLEVEQGAGRVYVNARPVRERALLRLGDALGIGGRRLRLCADGVPTRTGAATDGGIAIPAASAALRAVAGPLSGRAWALADRLELDAQGPRTVPGRDVLTLTIGDRRVAMDATALTSAIGVRVNGVATRRASLDDGDQLALGAHRFVLDLCAPAEPAPLQIMPLAETEAPASGLHRQMGWLVATAVVLALVLAWALLAHY